MSPRLSKGRRVGSIRRVRGRRLTLEALESRQLLSAATNPFVDASPNNGAFNVADGDVELVAGEVQDGFFDTNIAEGGYTTVLPGAGLVIPAATGALGPLADFTYRADGNLVIDVDLTATGDIRLASRAGNVALDDPTLTAGDDMWIWAAGNIVSDPNLDPVLLVTVRDVLVANGPDSRIDFWAGGNITLLGTSVTADDAVQMTALGNITINDAPGVPLGHEVAVEATDPVKGDVKLRAQAIDVSSAELSAGDDVELKTGNGDIVAPLVTIVAGEDVEMEAHAGNIVANGANIQALGGELEMRAARDINATGSALVLCTLVGEEVELKAGGSIDVTGTVVTADKDVEMEAHTGNIVASGATIQALGGKIEMEARLAISALGVGTVIEALGPKGEIELKARGGIALPDATVRARKEVEIEAGQRMNVDRATIEATGSSVEIEAGAAISAVSTQLLAGGNYGKVEIAARGPINLNSATVHADKEIEIESRDQIFADGASLLSCLGEVEVSARNSISMQNSTVRALKDIEIESQRGDVNLTNAHLASVTPTVGVSRGKILVEGNNIDITDAELVYGYKYRLDGIVVNVGATIFQDTEPCLPIVPPIVL